MSIKQNSLKLRKDGIYVQFGYRPWNSWLGYAGDCWYNLLRAVDDENLILLGHFNKYPFFEIDDESHKPIRKLILDDMKVSSRNITYNKQCKTVDKTFKSVIDLETIEDYYSYLHLDLDKDNFDPINIVKHLEKFDWNSLENKILIKGIDLINTSCQDHEQEEDHEEEDHEEEQDTLIKSQTISYCSSNVYNDPFSLITYTDDTNSFYIRYSHCWIEGNVMHGGNDHFNYGDETSNGEQIPFKYLTNSFKFTFVPFDLSEKSIWMDEYVKWKERFEYHKYYLNKNN